MAVVGGVLLIIIVAFLIWVAFMNKFEKVGNKIANKIDKTFKEEKGNKNDSSN